MLSFFFSGGSSAPNSKPLTRKDKHVVVSDANFLPDVEISDKTTQVGTSDWAGGIKSNAVSVLRGPRYAKTISSATLQREEYRKQAEKAEKEYLKKIADDQSASKEDRDWAAANLNENYREGSKLYNTGSYRDAVPYLEKAAADSSLNAYGRLEAMQKLISIGQLDNNKELWSKYVDKTMMELIELPEFKSKVGPEIVELLKKHKVSESLEQVEAVKELINTNPQAKEVLIQQYKANGYTAEQTQEFVNELSNFRHPFGS